MAGAPWEGSNKTVVITSGAGGTGYIGVQLAKTFAAGRIITAAAPAQIPWVKSLGADVVVDCALQHRFSFMSPLLACLHVGSQ